MARRANGDARTRLCTPRYIHMYGEKATVKVRKRAVFFEGNRARKNASPDPPFRPPSRSCCETHTGSAYRRPVQSLACARVPGNNKIQLVFEFKLKVESFSGCLAISRWWNFGGSFNLKGFE